MQWEQTCSSKVLLLILYPMVNFLWSSKDNFCVKNYHCVSFSRSRLTICKYTYIISIHDRSNQWLSISKYFSCYKEKWNWKSGKWGRLRVGAEKTFSTSKGGWKLRESDYLHCEALGPNILLNVNIFRPSFPCFWGFAIMISPFSPIWSTVDLWSDCVFGKGFTLQ